MDVLAAPDETTPWQHFQARLPMRAALTAVAAVWFCGCIWSFHEQSDFAAAKDFNFPWLLPLVIDGLAVAMAGVAYAASLDGRPAIPARVATALAVAASAGSNAAWAWERSTADSATISLAIGIPVAANLAFEVLLSELRQQVQRRRGQPAPAVVPYPRFIRLLLAPRSTFAAWRRLVLDITAVEHQAAPAQGARPETTAAAQWPQLAAPTPVVAGNGHVTPAAAQWPQPAAPTPVVAGNGHVTPVAAQWPQLAAPTPVVASDGHVAPTRNGQLPPAARTQRPPAHRTSMATPLDVDGAGPDDRIRRVAQLLADGQELTGESVGGMFGCSARTGRRLLQQGANLLARHDADVPSEPVAP